MPGRNVFSGALTRSRAFLFSSITISFSSSAFFVIHHIYFILHSLIKQHDEHAVLCCQTPAPRNERKVAVPSPRFYLVLVVLHLVQRNNPSDCGPTAHLFKHEYICEKHPVQFSWRTFQTRTQRNTCEPKRDSGGQVAEQEKWTRFVRNGLILYVWKWRGFPESNIKKLRQQFYEKCIM